MRARLPHPRAASAAGQPALAKLSRTGEHQRVNCVQCARQLPEAREAICIFVTGDEYIYSYFFCEHCELYTVEGYHDRFMGESEAFLLPQVSREEGDRAVALIRACPAPNDKHCGCASHVALYTGRVGPSA